MGMTSLGLALAWILMPRSDPLMRLFLEGATASVIGAAMAVLVFVQLRSRFASPSTASAGQVDLDQRILADVSDPHVEAFIDDGITNSRRFGRTAGVICFKFSAPTYARGSQYIVVDNIADDLREATSALDAVHAPGDGTIIVFLAQLPGGASVPQIGGRLLDDLRHAGGPVCFASSVSMGSAIFPTQGRTASALIEHARANLQIVTAFPAAA
jgi:hypothetical protein